MALTKITDGISGEQAANIIAENETKLLNNSLALAIAGIGGIAVNINYTSGEITVKIPANTRVLFGETSRVITAEQNVSATALSNYRYLVMDTATGVFQLIAGVDRINYVTLAVLYTYNATHQNVVRASVWSLNGVSQTQDIFGDLTKLKNNSDPSIIPGAGGVVATINYTTGAVKVTIPIGSRVVYGAASYTTTAAVSVELTFTGYRYLIFDPVTNVFSLVTETTRLSGVILGVLLTYNNTHTSVIKASVWSLNGVKQEMVTIAAVASSGVVPKNYGAFLNPTSTIFDFNAFIRIEAIEGAPEAFYNTDGTLKEVYLVYFRFKGFGPSPLASTIIQIAYKGATPVGVNNIVVASINDSVTDYSAKPIAAFTLLGNPAAGFTGLKISLIIDLAKIPVSILGLDAVKDTLRLNTLLFVEQLRATQVFNIAKPLAGKKIVCFGDSVTEFGNYPALIGSITGATVTNVGFGGCRMCKRVSSGAQSLAYNQMAMYALSDTLSSGDFTALEAAAVWLRDNGTPPDDNVETVARLKAIDFSTVDMVTIFYGTNDFTSNENPLGDGTGLDPLNLSGAINYVLNNLLTKYPHLKVAFITPTHRYMGVTGVSDTDTTPNGLGLFLSAYCDTIITSANRNHLPGLNLYKEGGFNKYNHQLYFGNDGVHPNTAGYAWLSQRLSAYITGLFRYV